MSKKTIEVQQAKQPNGELFGKGKPGMITIFRVQDLGYAPDGNEKYFVLENSTGYGYFQDAPVKKYTAGEILDEFRVTVTI